MNSRKNLTRESEDLGVLKSLVEVYEEIAASRMQRVRRSVLAARDFLADLLTVFGRVREAYKEKKGLSRLARNGKTVAVFVSANAGLYGDIVDRTYEKFTKYVRESNPDVVVVGKLGVKMLADRKVNFLYNYFDFPDDSIDAEAFLVMMRYLLQFEKIVVFYGKFKNILSQEATSTVVSGENLDYENGEVEKGTKFLFEPTVEEIARIFEGQVLASVFEQTLHESQLAKFASRLFNLDRAVVNVDKSLGKVHGDLLRLEHKTENKKQLSRMSGIALWA